MMVSLRSFTIIMASYSVGLEMLVELEMLAGLEMLACLDMMASITVTGEGVIQW
jgi:hypothetical protein